MKNPNLSLIVSDLKAIILMASTRKTKLFAYGFVFAFVACTTFLAFNSSSNAFSPWFTNFFSSSSLEPPIAPHRSQASGVLAYLNPNSSSPADDRSGGANGSSKDAILGNGSVGSGPLRMNGTQVGVGPQDYVKNGTAVTVEKDGGLEMKNQNQNYSVSGVTEKKQGNNESEIKKALVLESKNQTNIITEVSKSNETSSSAPSSASNGAKGTNLTSSMGKGAVLKAISGGNGKKREKWIEDMIGCDFFQGHWVKDDSYPLYSEGSCPHIDEPFDCYLNGRPDRNYQKLRWQPDGCNIPR